LGLVEILKHFAVYYAHQKFRGSRIETAQLDSPDLITTTLIISRFWVHLGFKYFQLLCQ